LLCDCVILDNNPWVYLSIRNGSTRYNDKIGLELDKKDKDDRQGNYGNNMFDLCVYGGVCNILYVRDLKLVRPILPKDIVY
jgi:hypothetical protein